MYQHCSNKDLMTAALDGLIAKFDLKGQTLGDVAVGAVLKHSRDWNLARESVIESGLSIRTPAVDLQRACGTSMEAAIMIANKIALGQIESGIGGGTDTVSDAPIVYNDPYRNMLLDMHAAHSPLERIKPLFRFRPSFLKPEFPGVNEPRTGLSMGESTEITAKEWEVQREHQDQLALASHMKAAAAYDEGFYEDHKNSIDSLRRDALDTYKTRVTSSSRYLMSSRALDALSWVSDEKALSLSIMTPLDNIDNSLSSFTN